MTDSIETSENMAEPWLVQRAAAEQPLLLVKELLLPEHHVHALRTAIFILRNLCDRGCTPDDPYGGLLDGENAESLEELLTALVDQSQADAPRAAQYVRNAIRAEILNTPELHSFSEGVTLEALHQRNRWGSAHDAGKAPSDWFWLVGYLAGKALQAHATGNTDKALHHTISTAAALANWHAAIAGTHTAMRPGIDPDPLGIGAGFEGEQT